MASTRLTPTSRRGWFLRLVLALAIGLALTGCRADATIVVDVEEDGSGLVTAELVMDAETAAAIVDLDPDAGGLPLSDLAYAGWDVESPTQTDEGLVIRASKGFGTISQFSEVMGELSSDTGLFRDFNLTWAQSFGRLDYSLRGTIDTSNGFDSFTDPELDAALDRSLEAIADHYGADLADISITMEVVMPGELQEDTSTGQVETAQPGTVEGRWTTVMDQPGRVEVILNTTRRSITAQVLRGLAVVAGVIAALIVFAQLVRWLSGRGRRPAKPKVRPADALGRTPEQVAAEAAEAAVAARVEAAITGEHKAIDPNTGAPEETAFPYKVVALDGMGVLYKEGNDITNLLIPFARDGGSVVPDAEIVAKARLVSLGRLTSADFWTAIGVRGDGNALDTAYLANHQLMPGVVKYLRGLRERGVTVACITNDGSRWATKLRASHSLETLIDTWVVSGSVGVRKPDAPIFEVLRRVTEESAEAILVVDDDLETLDAARTMGFATAWYNPEGTRDEANGHDVWRRFDVDDDDGKATEAIAATGPSAG